MRFLLRSLTGSVLGALAWSMFMVPLNVPVTRLLTNLGAYVKDHPNDSDGFYRLGRVYYMAFALDVDSLPYYEDKKSNELGHLYNRQIPGKAALNHYGSGLPEAQRIAYAKEAVRLLKKAIELDPKNGLYELGLACVYEDGHSLLGDEAWVEDAAQHYLAAFQLSLDEDAKTKMVTGGLGTLISFEAGSSYLRLVKQRGVRPDEEGAVNMVDSGLGRLARLPMAVTPIVLSLHPTAGLKDLLAPDSSVRFDLDGMGRAASYQWLRPDAALLVWDPARTGHVTS